MCEHSQELAFTTLCASTTQRHGKEHSPVPLHLNQKGSGVAAYTRREAFIAICMGNHPRNYFRAKFIDNSAVKPRKIHVSIACFRRIAILTPVLSARSLYIRCRACATSFSFAVAYIRQLLYQSTLGGVGKRMPLIFVTHLYTEFAVCVCILMHAGDSRSRGDIQREHWVSRTAFHLLYIY